MRRMPVLPIALVALAVGACGSAAETSESSTAPTSAVTQLSSPSASPATPADDAEPAAAAGVEVAEVAVTDADQFGQLLTAGDGLTLYVFLADTGGVSSCYDACADNWPPVLTNDGVAPVGDVDAALLGTVERDDGTTQVTYADQPLYFYSGDAQQGDILGYGVGDVWFPVGPDGEVIEREQRPDEGDGY